MIASVLFLVGLAVFLVITLVMTLMTRQAGEPFGSAMGRVLGPKGTPGPAAPPEGETDDS